MCRALKRGASCGSTTGLETPAETVHWTFENNEKRLNHVNPCSDGDVAAHAPPGGHLGSNRSWGEEAGCGEETLDL